MPKQTKKWYFSTLLAMTLFYAKTNKKMVFSTLLAQLHRPISLQPLNGTCL
jgi:hypothetical protein